MGVLEIHNNLQPL